MGNQITRVDPAADRFGRDLKLFRCLGNGVEDRSSSIAPGCVLKAHGIRLLHREGRFGLARWWQLSTHVPPDAPATGPEAGDTQAMELPTGAHEAWSSAKTTGHDNMSSQAKITVLALRKMALVSTWKIADGDETTRRDEIKCPVAGWKPRSSVSRG